MGEGSAALALLSLVREREREGEQEREGGRVGEPERAELCSISGKKP